MEDGRVDTAEPAPRWASRAAPWLVAAALVTLGVVAWWQQRVAFDDAFISYRYASNWVEGRGLVFNQGERVEGFSHPLWVGVAAAALRSGLDPFSATRALGVASHVLVLGLLGFGLARLAAPLGARALWLLPAAGVLVLPVGFAAVAGSGLETAFVALCLVALGASLLLPDASPAARALRAGAGTLAVLTRMDAVLAVVACALARCVAGPRGERRAAWREALLGLVAPALALVALVLAREIYYGEWLPNSYYAKRADEWHLSAGLSYLLTFALSSPQALLLGGLGILALARESSIPLRRAAAYAACCGVLYAAYIARVGGDFMQYRFIWQLYPLLAGLGLLGLVQLARRQLAVAALLAVVLAGLSIRTPVLEHKYGMQSLAEMNDYVEQGKEAGRRLRELLPPGTRVATTLAGTIGYYSELPILDQWGLNDRFVARGPSIPRFLRGHYKSASTDYMLQRGTELELQHPRVCPCDALCTKDVPMLFLRLGGNRCLRTFLLAPGRPLVERVCGDPGHFLLHRASCAELRSKDRT